ncbi:MAG: DUF3365 domain-containing protein, partial [Gemmatimonadota bacterium]
MTMTIDDAVRAPNRPAGRRPARRALALALLASGLTACGTGADDAGPPPLTADEEAHARDVGGAAAATLQSTLAPRLMAAMQEDGPAGAVRFCAGAADSLTAAASEAAGVEVARTSLRVRNPDNAPDRWEEAALRHFQALVEAGDSLPAGWVQPVSAEEMRFYAPLRIAPLCVNCHGPRDALAPGVAEILDAEYPDDRATGYRPGDLRGLVRV